MDAESGQALLTNSVPQLAPFRDDLGQISSQIAVRLLLNFPRRAADTSNRSVLHSYKYLPCPPDVRAGLPCQLLACSLLPLPVKCLIGTVFVLKGCPMKSLLRRTSSLAARVSGLIREAETRDPGMQEAAAMVYVGDVYVLREQAIPSSVDGRGAHQFRKEFSVGL